MRPSAALRTPGHVRPGAPVVERADDDDASRPLRPSGGRRAPRDGRDVPRPRPRLARRRRPWPLRAGARDLLRPDAYLPAAALFYAFYVAVTVGWAVLGAASKGDAARRGAGLGFVAYATYDLTNWAVIRDWPALLVPVDLAWGVVLTTLAALAGRTAHEAVRGNR